MIDPRDAGIALQLAGVRLVLAVSSGKGGVGKSTCAVVGSLLLARRGLAVGLLDLDFQGASCHTLLGCRPGFPSEDRGLLPLEPVTGLRFATIASFVGERPAAMRGSALADALREMLAVTRWGALDVLVVDMPPGIHDTTLELARIAPKARHLVISTGSVVALTVASRLLRHLGEAGTAVAGLVENMAPSGIGGDLGRGAPSLAAREGVPFLGRLPFDSALEAATGEPGRLAATAFARDLEPIIAGAAGCSGAPGATGPAPRRSFVPPRPATGRGRNRRRRPTTVRWAGCSPRRSPGADFPGRISRIGSRGRGRSS
jgi:ATP-binding protein involved in chromosome partitioning